MHLLDKIEKDTQKLKLEEKYYLIEKLLKSVDNYNEQRTEEEWGQIVMERTVDIDLNKVQTLAAEDVMKSLKRKLR